MKLADLSLVFVALAASCTPSSGSEEMPRSPYSASAQIVEPRESVGQGNDGVSDPIGEKRLYSRSPADYAKLCEHDDLDACMQLARLYDSNSAERNIGRAIELYQRVCKHRRVEEPCLALGRILQRTPSESDRARAALVFQEACDNGSAEGCFEAARMHETGQGIVRDRDRAEALYRRACADGFDESCQALKDSRSEPDVTLIPGKGYDTIILGKTTLLAALHAIGPGCNILAHDEKGTYVECANPTFHTFDPVQQRLIRSRPAWLVADPRGIVSEIGFHVRQIRFAVKGLVGVTATGRQILDALGEPTSFIKGDLKLLKPGAFLSEYSYRSGVRFLVDEIYGLGVMSITITLPN